MTVCKILFVVHQFLEMRQDNQSLFFRPANWTTFSDTFRNKISSPLSCLNKF